ncbi:MAG: hypothetical protein IKF38_07205 [Clostridia bacterium]|nr:hypothetical protein [Clostridia bacterium]
MNKKDILNTYKRQEDKILLAQVLDKIDLMNKTQKIESTDFLDMYQISLVETFLKKIDFKNYILFGGFEEAERKILIVYPEKYTIEMLEKNYGKLVKIVRVELPDEEKENYSHRNYLGGIVKLGLKREKVGDILVFDDGADIVTVEDFAEILRTELGTLTRFQNSKIEVLELNQIRVQEIKIEEVKIIVPSLRLDNIVSDLARTSRSKATEIIEQERVFVNGKNETKLSKQIKQGDVITVRGKGRFVVKEFTGTTRSGRTVVSIEKYV